MVHVYIRTYSPLTVKHIDVLRVDDDRIHILIDSDIDVVLILSIKEAKKLLEEIRKVIE